MATDERGKRPPVSADEGNLLATVRNLWQYMWPAGRPDLKFRVILAIGALLVSKAATSVVPFVYKGIIDSLDGTSPDSALVLGIAIPVMLVIAYGLGNVIDAGFQQLRDVLFASVGQHAVRKLAYRTFQHLHRLSLRFHLARRTGGLSRVIERGTKGIETIVRFTMLNTAPTLVEFIITGTIFVVMFGWTYLTVLVVTIWLYLWFTIKASNWRISIRRDMNNSDTDANSKAIDSLLNFETVKYFANEAMEAKRFDASMATYEKSAIRIWTSLGTPSPSVTRLASPRSRNSQVDSRLRSAISSRASSVCCRPSAPPIPSTSLRRARTRASSAPASAAEIAASSGPRSS